MRKPTCLCGTCKTCRQRAANHRWKAKHPEKAKAYERAFNQKRSDQRAQARESKAASPVKKGSHRNLDDLALKWLQDKGYR